MKHEKNYKVKLFEVKNHNVMHIVVYLVKTLIGGVIPDATMRKASKNPTLITEFIVVSVLFIEHVI